MTQQRGRLTDAQRRALTEFLPEVAVDPLTGLDAAAIFGREAPLGVEIGFGAGDALLFWAENQPDWNLLGVEIYPPGIGSLLNRIQAKLVGNIRVAQARAEEVLERVLKPESVSEFRIFFPDPWPKKRHHKRRLIQPAFVAGLAERLACDGVIHAATDWAPYAEWMEATFAQSPSLVREPPSQAEMLRPVTRFERRGQRLGHDIFEFRYRKRS